MKILNLVNELTSEIEYKVSKMPDGQQDIVITRYGDRKSPVTIKSRFNNFRDLELIICATVALRHLGVESVSLYIPYLLGARGDRKFQLGGTRYLKDVVAPIINSLKFDQVTVIDAHSTVAENVIDKLINIPTELIVNSSPLVRSLIADDTRIVSPDAGAIKKVENIAKSLKYTKEIVVCSKHRDVDGKITGTKVPLVGELLSDDDSYIIFDDICDGGRTFTEIAKSIRSTYQEQNGIQPKIYLYITHGIFSAGFLSLHEYFDKVICTNSYSDVRIGTENDTVNEMPKDFVEQINVW